MSDTLLTPQQVADWLNVPLAWVRDHTTRRSPRLLLSGLVTTWSGTGAAHRGVYAEAVEVRQDSGEIVAVGRYGATAGSQRR